MTNTTLIQPSMSAGELSPEMYGRVDTEHYKLGLALARNFCVDYHGGIFNRPGTRHVSVVDNPVRHIPFERSPKVTYMLEFGEKTLKVLKQGKYINDIHGDVLTVVTPYSSDELPEIRYIQSVDVMTLFYSGRPMYQVKHYAENDWRVEEFTSKSGPYEKINIDETKNMWANGQTGTISLYSDFDVFTPEMVGRHIYLEATGSFFTKSWIQRMVAKVGDVVYYAGNYYECTDARSNSLTGDSPPVHMEGERWDGPDQDLPNDNDDHYIGIKWRYSNSGFGEVKITKYVSPREVEAEVTVELPKDVTKTGSVAQLQWKWEDESYQQSFVIPPPTPDTYNQPSFTLELKIHRTGIVGDWEVIPRKDNWYVIDLWGTPTLFISPQPVWGAPGITSTADIRLTRSGTPGVDQVTYKWAFETLTDENGYPKCGAYYSDRLCLGGNRIHAQSIWMSKTDSYDDFGKSMPLLAEDSLTLNVAGVRLSEINHLLPLNALLAFTSGGVWALSPTESKRVLATDPPAIDVQSYNGCNFVAPLTTGNEALYLQRGQQIVREINYDFNSASFADVNLCVRSSHIFKTRRVISWAYAKNPYCLIWCVFDDGTAATLTYMKEQQVWGWTTHETNGKYLTVSSVDEEDRSAVYFSVLRNGEINVEYQADRNIIDVEDSFFFDNGLTIDNRANGTLVITGGNKWQYPENVQLVSSEDYFDPSMEGKPISIKDDDDVYMLLITSVTDAKNVTARLEQSIPEHMVYTDISEWGLAINEITGLNHLEGETVGVLMDGMDNGKYFVQEGKITPKISGLVAHVGLPFRSLARTLPIEVQTKYTATTKTKVKSVNSVSLELYDSYGGAAGTTINSMYDIKQRLYENYVSPVEPRTGLGQVDVSSSYNNDGQIYFMQDAPLPFNVLSVIPEVEIGG